MDLVEEFVRRYIKEYDYYDQVARIAAQRLEATLRTAGIRCIVTSRAKSIARLREKCKQRQKDANYTSVQDIYDDIVDLAGVRVALYFPAERDQVGGTIKKLFQVDEEIVFPKEGERSPNNRFLGYLAIHHRVRLREQDLADEIDKRYAQARIEIQVASILMHAWSEVQHDLIYKPLAGELSEDEYAILDQLNGLVLSGELALEVLQRAGEARVKSQSRFANHYDLASHLIKTAGTQLGRSINDSGLGRVDLLFELLMQLQLNTPNALSKYMDNLHDNLEDRPLAEQIIDALLSEDTDRYELYEELSPKYGESSELQQWIGSFITKWIELEQLINSLVADHGVRRGAVTPSQLRDLNILPEPLMGEYEGVRRFRNDLIHGHMQVSPIQIERAISVIDYLVGQLKNYRTRPSEGTD
jgi:ppGpp synthetase/RelA/SpoT-type nucleotidyltranferase